MTQIQLDWVKLRFTTQQCVNIIDWPASITAPPAAAAASSPNSITPTSPKLPRPGSFGEVGVMEFGLQGDVTGLSRMSRGSRHSGIWPSAAASLIKHDRNPDERAACEESDAPAAEENLLSLSASACMCAECTGLYFKTRFTAPPCARWPGRWQWVMDDNRDTDRESQPKPIWSDRQERETLYSSHLYDYTPGWMIHYAGYFEATYAALG